MDKNTLDQFEMTNIPLLHLLQNLETLIFSSLPLRPYPSHDFNFQFSIFVYHNENIKSKQEPQTHKFIKLQTESDFFAHYLSRSQLKDRSDFFSPCVCLNSLK